jgi:hypothetical protein
MSRKTSLRIYPLALIALLSLFTYSCKKDKDEVVQIPVIATSPVTDITQFSATCGGSLTSEGASAISAVGICWDTTASPSISSAISHDSAVSGNFSSIMHGLSANKKYYVRAYAINSYGVGYGPILSFNTLPLQLPTLAFVTDEGYITGDVNLGSNVIFHAGIIAHSNATSSKKLANFKISVDYDGYIFPLLDSTIDVSTYSFRFYSTTQSTTGGTERWKFKITDTAGQVKEISFLITRTGKAVSVNKPRIGDIMLRPVFD